MILSALEETDDVDRFEKKCLALQLQNRHVIDFDGLKVSYFDPGITFFRHMLQNCPKIKSVRLRESSNHPFLHLLWRDDLFGLMASCWQNLSFLNVGHLCDSVNKRKDDQSIIPAICCRLPNLRYFICYDF